MICFILHQLLLNSRLGDQLLSSVQLLAGFTNCDSFKLGVVVSEKNFSIETTVASGFSGYSGTANRVITDQLLNSV